MNARKPYTACAVGLVLVWMLAAGGPASAQEADTDTTLALRNQEEETVFRSLTIEGENRIRIEFDRPDLIVDLDPATAPGLTWGSAHDILDRTVPDLVTPFLAMSAHVESPYTPRPWLAAYHAGPVARFTNDLDGVESWHLLVVDSRGREAVAFSGKGNPPGEIPWDGLDGTGDPVAPGLTYSFVLETYDKAGNKRHFTGDGFEIDAYRLEGDLGPRFLVSGDQWRSDSTGNGRHSALLLEAASRFNLRLRDDVPIEIRATARSIAKAEALGSNVADALTPLLAGGRVRLVVTTVVEEGAPPAGTLLLQPWEG